MIHRSCAALYGLNHLGPDGYHWRICVEDKPSPGDAGPAKSFSWWDIQDENATLPVKNATQYQLAKFFNPPKEDSSDAATKAAKATFKSLGKAVSQAVGGDVNDQGPMVSVVAFKLLDLVKMHDDFGSKHSAGFSGRIPQSTRSAPPPRRSPPAPSRPAPATSRQPAQRATASQPRTAAQQRPSEPSLMDFGGAPSNASSRPGYNHSSSMPTSRSTPPANESRAEKLQREYKQKNQNANRVWDDVDQRWVEKKPAGASPGGLQPPKKKEVGIKLDPASARNKPPAVQQAVKERYDEMRGQQDKAVNEVRQREAAKKQAEAEEDDVRKRLEPKIKTWAEEHGKKKQLRALLASLHTILWQGAKWKQVTIGDLLDDKKVTRSFQRASLVVHPDKTGSLDAEKRFLAKRIFDALCQAKADFDNGKK